MITQDEERKMAVSTDKAQALPSSTPVPISVDGRNKSSDTLIQRMGQSLKLGEDVVQHTKDIYSIYLKNKESSFNEFDVTTSALPTLTTLTPSYHLPDRGVLR